MDNAQIFKALADRSRLRILRMLNIRPLCVCEIREILGLATSTVSQHLALLRHAGFIYDIKDNKWVDYHLNRQSNDTMVHSLLQVILSNALDDDIYKKDAAEVRTVDRNALCRL
ncbi:metalloregulator ArsR/SmtB family transcription factor [candidate division KSB1 bacterium]|nr:metalloregulator ArsR/SmtB family transcription factor [candidate division KSB1 bacterium]